jgi:hypothetical protein
MTFPFASDVSDQVCARTPLHWRISRYYSLDYHVTFPFASDVSDQARAKTTQPWRPHVLRILSVFGSVVGSYTLIKPGQLNNLPIVSAHYGTAARLFQHFKDILRKYVFIKDEFEQFYFVL